MNAIERFTPLVPQERIEPRSTMDMIGEAAARGASIEVIEKLMGLHERFEAAQARRAFDAAVAGAKSKIKTIKKTRKGHNGKYEDMAAVAEEVAPILAEYGLSFRYRTAQADRITVTCIVAHKDGHFEETTLTAGADKTGNKNEIQAIGSTVTYLQRYTLKAALGLAAAEDDDGRAAGKATGPISEEQLDTLLTLADEVEANKPAFCNWMGVDSFPDIPAKEFEKAKRALEAKRGSTMLRARG